MAAVVPRSVLCVALVLLLASSQTHALSLLSVAGNLFCSPNGNSCGGCSPLAGIRVELRNGDVVIATVLTGANGAYLFTVSNLAVLNVVNIDKLKVRVPLPINACPVLSTVTGALEGTPSLVGNIFNGVATLTVSTLRVVLA